LFADDAGVGDFALRCTVSQEFAGQLHRSGFRVYADYPQTHASRLNRDGRLFDPIRVQISATFVKDQSRRATVAVGHKRNLRTRYLGKIVANALRKYLILLSIYLREQMIALPDMLITTEVTS